MPSELEAELFPGLRVPLNLNDATQLATYWQGDRFEYPTGQILRKWASETDATFFDIGSNYGFFSFFLASQLPQLGIHSFEPNPLTYAKLKLIRDTNKLNRLHPWNMGLGAVHAKLVLHQGVEDSGHSTFGDHPELAGNSLGQIDVLPFDDWLKLQNISLPQRPLWVAKIDVEGFELNVLHGMTEALSQKAFKGIVIEINPFTLKFCGTSAEEVFNFLAEYKYFPIKEETLGFAKGDSANAFFTVDSATT